MEEWEKGIRQVTPYVPGEQPAFETMIKLNTNENPYEPSPYVTKAIENIDPAKLRLYPDFSAKPLVKALSETYNISEDNIFVGVGSDDVLSMSFLTFFNTGKPVFFPDITYSFYDVWAELYKIPYEIKALDDNFRLKASDYYKPNGGIVIPNPNAPTSIAENRDFFEDIIRHNKDSVVIIDEAYVDFGAESVLPLIEKYDNLLVVQTFSKSRSLAGIRIGFAMGSSKLIKALNDVKYSFNSYTMNYPSICVGTAALKDTEYFKNCCGKIMDTRKHVTAVLEELGFTVLPSSSNFLFITHPQVKASELFEALKKKNIYVRFFNKPRVCDYLRVTVGTPAQMTIFTEFLKNFLLADKV